MWTFSFHIFRWHSDFLVSRRTQSPCLQHAATPPWKTVWKSRQRNVNVSHLPGLLLGRRAGGDWPGEDLGCEWMAHSHVIEASPTVSCSQHLRPALPFTLHILVFPHQCSESTHLPCNYLDSGHSCDDSPSHLANSFQNSITHLLAPAWPPARRVTGNTRLEPHFPQNLTSSICMLHINLYYDTDASNFPPLILAVHDYRYKN